MLVLFLYNYVNTGALSKLVNRDYIREIVKLMLFFIVAFRTSYLLCYFFSSTASQAIIHSRLTSRARPP